MLLHFQITCLSRARSACIIGLGQLFHVPHCLTDAHVHMLLAIVHVKVMFCVPSF